MAHCKEVLIINTKITDYKTIEEMIKPIRTFAYQYDIVLVIYFASDGKLISNCETDGRTSAYCKGMVAEVKQMIKDIFHCKLERMLYKSSKQG